MSGYRPKDYTGDRDYQSMNRFGFRGMHGLSPTDPNAAAQSQEQAAAVAAAMAARARPDEYAAHLAAKYDPVPSPYYATAHRPGMPPHPSMVAPYGQNPYAGMHDTSAVRSAYSVPPQPASSPLGDPFGAHRPSSKQQAIQQAVAANFAAYGGPPATASGGVMDQRYAAAYGIPTPGPTVPPPYVKPPPYDSQAAHEIAIMQEAFRNERAASLKRHTYQTGSVSRSSITSSAMKIKPKPSASMPMRSPSSTMSTPLANRTTSPLSPEESESAGSYSEQSHSGHDDDDNSEMMNRPPKKKKEAPVMGEDADGKPIVLDRGHTWYMGSVPLGVDDDKYWLSELQVYLRANFAEAFAASEEDIAAPMHGRNKPIVLGQVGIRCMHCKNDNPAERGQQATSYPSLISGIYNSVQQMLRLHLECCLSMPADVRQRIEQLKLSCSSRGGRKQYWVDSAKRLGLVDTPHGIHFVRDPSGPLPPLTGPSVNSNVHRKKKAIKEKKKPPPPPPPPKPVEPEPEPEKPPPPPIDPRPLVFPEDKPLISDYLYLTLEQMAATTLQDSDRVGCYKTRRVGFPGLACRHCVGQAGCGRYFPASEASLSQTTTSQTIMNHVRNCRRCPLEIRENLEIMKRNRMGPEGKRSDKPKHGGRKVFFHRLWARIQGLPIDEDAIDFDEAPRKKRKKAAKKREPMEGSDEVESEADEEVESGSAEEGSETETDNEEDIESVNSSDQAKVKRKGGKKKAIQWYDGCVRLTKTDDPHWLSEMECFARSELVEVFCLTNKEDLEGFSGRKEPAIGQVGVRCVFCKSMDPTERPNGCLVFPDSLSTIHTKVGDMIRLHFPSCPSMPEDARQTFKSLRGFDAKTAGDDSSQYWVDAARDIGLTNMPPGGSRDGAGWGVTFGRDPLQPSPADEFDLEATSDDPPTESKNSLVRPDDRGMCTDQVMLLLRQVRPCRFKNGDRRAGPGSRGRDRVLGFPGLCCKHCTGKNTLGRYFPVSAKNLTDSTANSLQAHVSSCTRCPEPIKASLAYLGHRSILQKAELSGSWKKTFFQKVWSRLHVEREWKSADDDDSAAYSSGDEQNASAQHEDGSKEDGGDGASESDKEEDLGDHMNVLVKAAAIWLTEQDVATDSSKTAARATKAAARSNVPTSKRPASGPTSRSGRSTGTGPASGTATSTLTSKRRRVHF